MSDWVIDTTFGQPVVKDGCGVFGIMRKPGAPKISNKVAVGGLACIKYRGSSQGAGYACFDSETRSTFKIKAFIKERIAADTITYELSQLLGRPQSEEIESLEHTGKTTNVLKLEFQASKEMEALLDLRVDGINGSLFNSDGKILGRIFSYGRSVQVFKEVGYPLDIAKLYGLDEEDRIFGDLWIAHTRQPTNSPGSSPIWSHPFCALDCAIVHNGDISSFGANLELLSSLGFRSHVGTDSEVVSRLLNYLIRVEKLSPVEASRILTNPFEENSIDTPTQIVSKYKGAKLDGPFAVVAGYADDDDTYLIALTDRSKFRPIILGEDENNFYVASEEIQIRMLSRDARVWTPEPGSFFVASAKSGLISSGTRRELLGRSSETLRISRPEINYHDASNLSFSEMNQKIQDAYANGESGIGFRNVAGHRYIGIGITTGNKPFEISLEGYPGNCLANLNDGASFEVFGNVADDLADTMHSGRVTVHGSARDVAAQALQGGDVLIRGSAGNRAAIQMREYMNSKPYLIIGETADDYLAEYMAGGVVVVLNLTNEKIPVGSYVGTGMVGGAIYIRGRVDEQRIGLPPKKVDILNYLEAERLDGQISLEDYERISNLEYPSEKAISSALPEKIAKRIKTLFFRGKYTRPISVEYRPLSHEKDDLKPFLQKMEDFFNTFEIPVREQELVLKSSYTVIRPTADEKSETPVPPQEIPVEE